MNGRYICRVLTGPTGSGKSETAMRLAVENGWDILCMDSMQVYRRMDIGTAKPTPEDRQKVNHYLLDLCEPSELYNVSSYVQDALSAVEREQKAGREFIFVGGTGLYLEGMMKPLGMGHIPANESLRQELYRLLDGPDGKKRLDERLRKADPDTACRLPLNDIRRRIRAIEVSEITGIPFSKQPESPRNECFEWRVVTMAPERDILYDRINRRVIAMMDAGLVNEVQSLLSEGITKDAQSMQAIGYKEVIPFLEHQYTIDKTIELIQTATRHYAKRQMTFMRRFENQVFIDPFSGNAYDRIEKTLRGE